MSTRGTFTIKNKSRTYNLYRHCDNYPLGVAFTLLEFYFQSESEVVHRPKTRGVIEALCAGNAEIIDHDPSQHSDREYHYYFSKNDTFSVIQVTDTNKNRVIFSGCFKSFFKWIATDHEANIKTNKWYQEDQERVKEGLNEVSTFLELSSQLEYTDEATEKKKKEDKEKREAEYQKRQEEREAESVMRAEIERLKKDNLFLEGKETEISYSNEKFSFSISESENSISDLEDRNNMPAGYIRGKRDTKNSFKKIKVLSPDERAATFKNFTFYDFITWLGVSVHTYCRMD